MAKNIFCANKAKKLCNELVNSSICSLWHSNSSILNFLPIQSNRVLIPITHGRIFCNTTSLLKKIRKVDRENKSDTLTDGKSLNLDPCDFTDLNLGIEDRFSRLKSELSKLRTGGRFNPELLENLRVTLKRDSKKTERLGDLAQVIPKGGRNLIIIVGDKAYIKSIISAIQASPVINLQPVLDSQNPLQLTVPIPPPTKESRDAALATATKLGEATITGIRMVRGSTQKRLRNLELKKLSRPDDLKKAHREMEKIVEKAIAEVKGTVDMAQKSMEHI